MKVRAPGKIVLSGAYVVLDGAPAVVAAVDRFVEVDTLERCSFESDELRAYFADRAPPSVDATALRYHGRKLGLGSSAAMLAAAIAADLLDPSQSEHRYEVGDALRQRVAELAFEAHHKAQGGGSGVDILASTWGGILACLPGAPGTLPSFESVRLPDKLVVEVWACPTSASTREMVSKIREYREQNVVRYDDITEPARRGAAAFVDACAENSLIALLYAARVQCDTLRLLDDATGAGIFPKWHRDLDELAKTFDAVFAQAGAGGGDIALYFSSVPSPSEWRNEAISQGLFELSGLCLGAGGVSVVPTW